MKKFKIIPKENFDIESMKKWYKASTESKIDWLSETVHFLYHVKPMKKR